MAKVNKDSIRQQVMNLAVNKPIRFPIKKMYYIRTLTQALKQTHGFKYETGTTKTHIVITRIQ